MSDKFKELIKGIADMLEERLEKEDSIIERVVANLEVDKETYKQLMIREVLDNVWVAASVAVPPYEWRKPEEVKAEALRVLEKKLRRDRRLYLPSSG